VSRVTKNIIYNGIGQGLSVILSFVAVRFVFRRLGAMPWADLLLPGFQRGAGRGVQLGVCESAVREIASHHKTGRITLKVSSAPVLCSTGPDTSFGPGGLHRRSVPGSSLGETRFS